MSPPRVLVVSFTIHGMVNPSLRFCERLAGAGADVTFAVPLSSHRKIIEPRSDLAGITFAPFSDGFDSGFPFGSTSVDPAQYDSELRLRGSRAVSGLIAEASSQNKPFSCLVYTPVVTWAAETAERFGIPAVLLWVQAATVFDVIHAYYHGYGDYIDELYACSDKDENRIAMKLRALGLPIDLALRDLPNFMDPSSPQAYYAKYFREDFERFGVCVGPAQSKTVLVNTFDELESEALTLLESKNVKLVAIGPLIEGKTCDYCPVTEWVREKERGSVVYVSFGSISVLAESQMDEVAKGLVEFGRPFVWVVRGDQRPKNCHREQLEKLGMIVDWCDQVAVLGTGTLGCFVTHCGWNSTLESLVAGVPLVGFPQRIDQLTNAKLIQDYWKVGVRVDSDPESGIVKGDELNRCLEVVFGGEEFRVNAEKWKGLASQALGEGGSSRANIDAFLRCQEGESGREVES